LLSISINEKNTGFREGIKSGIYLVKPHLIKGSQVENVSCLSMIETFILKLATINTKLYGNFSLCELKQLYIKSGKSFLFFT